MADYRTDLERFLVDLDLKRIDAHLDEKARAAAETVSLKKHLAIYLDLGYDEEEALRQIRATGRFKSYFAAQDS